MKKILTLTAIALVTIVACNKSGNTPQEAAISTQPAWVLDETLPVPIEFGAGSNNIATKGVALDAAAFETATFDVLALDQAGAAMPGFEGGIPAQNELRDEAPIYTIATFDEVKYYPYLLSAGYFSFYAYRVDGYHQELNADNEIEDVEIGQNDIIWAEAKPTEAQLSALGLIDTSAEPAETYDDYPGFNAKYVRAARAAAGGEENATYYDYLPNLAFSHLTSQIQFVLRAADDTAAEKLADAGVSVQSLVVGGVSTSATFDVVAGTLTGGDEGTIEIQNIPETFTDPEQFTITVAGDPCGEPIFILPMEFAAANEGIQMSLTISLPGMEPLVIEKVLTVPSHAVEAGVAYEFEAGVAYQYTIILQSVEEIEVVTSLADWGTPVNAGSIEIE